MKKLHFNIFIEAPVQAVWDTMLDLRTYREWTSVFNEDSHYKGSWDEGAKMLFLGKDADGNKSGLVSVIATNRKHEYVSIKHIGLVENGKQITSGEAVDQWAPAYENYTFTAVDGGTELQIDTDTDENFVHLFKELWPKALELLKYLAEE